MTAKVVGARTGMLSPSLIVDRAGLQLVRRLNVPSGTTSITETDLVTTGYHRFHVKIRGLSIATSQVVTFAIAGHSGTYSCAGGIGASSGALFTPNFSGASSIGVSNNSLSSGNFGSLDIDFALGSGITQANQQLIHSEWYTNAYFVVLQCRMDGGAFPATHNGLTIGFSGTTVSPASNCAVLYELYRYET